MSGRSKSPQPPLSLRGVPLYYANMSVEEVERRLGRPIPRLPLTIVEKLRGKTPEPDPFALDAARQEVFEYDFHLHRNELERNKRNSVGQNASSAPNPNAGPFDYKAHYRTSDARPKNCPMDPISKDELRAAAQEVSDLEVAARSSATTIGIPKFNYVEFRKQLDDARDRQARLQQRFAKQERLCPEAHKYLSRAGNLYAISGPPLPRSIMSQYGPDSGGKSKRVKRTKTCKSKRSKRSKTCKNRVHKRRN